MQQWEYGKNHLRSSGAEAEKGAFEARRCELVSIEVWYRTIELSLHTMSDDRNAKHPVQGELVSLRSRMLQLEREIRAAAEKTDTQVTSILIEQEELRRDVVTLEQKLAHVESKTLDIARVLKKANIAPGDAREEDDKDEKDAVSRDSIVIEKLRSLQDRVKQMEVEKTTLAKLYEELRASNEAISNLYVAKHRLHATFKPTEVMTIIQEILVELVGAKEFGILMVDQKKKVLRVVAGQGVDHHIPEKTIPVGKGIIGDAAITGKPFFFDAGRPAGERPHLPLATIPLKMKDATLGVVVIYQLLEHKPALTPIDHQLLDLVAEHAPKALLSAHLFSALSHKKPVVEPVWDD